MNRKSEIAWHPTLKALERLKKFGEGLSSELLMVLGGHLHTDLQVLADVC